MAKAPDKLGVHVCRICGTATMALPGKEIGCAGCNAAPNYAPEVGVITIDYVSTETVEGRSTALTSAEVRTSDQPPAGKPEDPPPSTQPPAE